ncbi:MAG TPA: hypothetical protein VKG84_06185, partial [Candidatus Acidoferrales bacterium]|nr:hypothetical protein [Candidatus Acidoferrales bacterium]
MKKIRMLLVLLAAAVVLPVARAQEKAPQTPSESATAYRVQVVLSEFDGTNKLSSMPYTIPIAQMAGEPRTQGSLRVGIRVPVNSSAKGAENSFQYVDIGMNLEVRV